MARDMIRLAMVPIGTKDADYDVIINRKLIESAAPQSAFARDELRVLTAIVMHSGRRWWTAIGIDELFYMDNIDA